MIDRNKIISQLENMEKSWQERPTYYLKQGVNQIRILPLQDSPEWPFINALVYYGFKGRKFVSPKMYGDEDPILKQLDVLNAGTQEDKNLAKSLMPRARIYILAIVRSQQEKGRVWVDFPKKVYKQILNIMNVADDDDDEITDFKGGCDIIITKTTPKNSKFPEYMVAKKNPKPLTKDPQKLKLWIEQEQPKFTQAIDHLNNEEMMQKWENYISGADEQDQEGETVAQKTVQSTQEQQVNVDQVINRFNKKFNANKK